MYTADNLLTNVGIDSTVIWFNGHTFPTIPNEIPVCLSTGHIPGLDWKRGLHLHKAGALWTQSVFIEHK